MVSEPGLKDVYIRPSSLNHVFCTYIYVHGIQRVKDDLVIKLWPGWCGDLKDTIYQVISGCLK